MVPGGPEAPAEVRKPQPAPLPAQPPGSPVTSRRSAGQAGLRAERVALHLAHKLTADGHPTRGPGSPTNIPGAWPPAPFASSPELSPLVGSSQHGQYPSWALLDSREPVSAQQHLCSPGGSPGPTAVSGGSSWPGPHAPSGFSHSFAALLLRPFLLLTAPPPPTLCAHRAGAESQAGTGRGRGRGGRPSGRLLCLHPGRHLDTWDVQGRG